MQNISRTFGGWCNISVNFVKDPSADQLTGSAVFSIQKLQVPDSSSRFEIKRIPPQKGPPKKARINLYSRKIHKNSGAMMSWGNLPQLHSFLNNHGSGNGSFGD